jgi:hypothetical protein
VEFRSSSLLEIQEFHLWDNGKYEYPEQPSQNRLINHWFHRWNSKTKIANSGKNNRLTPRVPLRRPLDCSTAEQLEKGESKPIDKLGFTGGIPKLKVSAAIKTTDFPHVVPLRRPLDCSTAEQPSPSRKRRVKTD